MFNSALSSPNNVFFLMYYISQKFIKSEEEEQELNFRTLYMISPLLGLYYMWKKMPLSYSSKHRITSLHFLPLLLPVLLLVVRLILSLLGVDMT
jgi:hypothetical protein